MRPATHPLAPPGNVVVDVDDIANLRQIQRELEIGVRYEFVGAPEARSTYAPIANKVAPEVSLKGLGSITKARSA